LLSVLPHGSQRNLPFLQGQVMIFLHHTQKRLPFVRVSPYMAVKEIYRFNKVTPHGSRNFSAKSYRSQMAVEKICRFNNHPPLQSKKNCRLEKAQVCKIKKPRIFFDSGDKSSACVDI
jgi:hypothetical protein